MFAYVLNQQISDEGPLLYCFEDSISTIKIPFAISDGLASVKVVVFETFDGFFVAS